jgi:hypothetical protein
MIGNIHEACPGGVELMWRCLAALWLLVAAPALAIDPGIASGRYHGEGGEIIFSHSIALRQGNEEGLIDANRTMRVVLSDVEVLPRALQGIAFLPVEAMAKAGEWRGLLLQFDPAYRSSMLVTILAEPSEGASLATITLTDTTGLWKKLNVAATRIGGDIDHEADDYGFTASFSAPVFENKVTADLKGPAAQASEQVRLLIAREQAFARGDLDAAKAMTSARGRAVFDTLPPEYLAELRTAAPASIADYRRIARVVVRGESAVAILPEAGSWQSFTRDEGKWLIE